MSVTGPRGVVTVVLHAAAVSPIGADGGGDVANARVCEAYGFDADLQCWVRVADGRIPTSLYAASTSGVRPWSRVLSGAAVFSSVSDSHTHRVRCVSLVCLRVCVWVSEGCLLSWSGRWRSVLAAARVHRSLHCCMQRPRRNWVSRRSPMRSSDYCRQSCSDLRLITCTGMR